MKLFYIMLDLLTEAIIRLGTCIKRGQRIFIRTSEIIGSGIVYIRIEVRKNRRNIHGMLAAVGSAKGRIVISRIRDTSRLIGQKRSSRILIVGMALMHRAIVHAAHQTDGRSIFRKIKL